MEKFGEISEINEIKLINSLKNFRTIEKYIRIASYWSFSGIHYLGELEEIDIPLLSLLYFKKTSFQINCENE